MLSQALHDEIVTPLATLPNRAKSAFIGSSSRSLLNLNSLNSNKKEDLDSSYMRPYQRKLITPNRMSLENYKFERPRSSSPEGDEQFEQQQRKESSPNEEGEKNLAKRVRQLERNNLSLRRMIELFETNNPGALTRSMTARYPPRQYYYRSHPETPNGPPTLRQGRVGSSWRHIKQTNDCGNANLLFIDGTVRINDSTRFPPSLYGYPPKMTSQSIDSFPSAYDDFSSELTSSFMSSNDYVKRRPMNLGAYSNQFSERARQGFEYWTKDRKLAENTKPKAAKIAIGHPYFKSGF